MSSQNSTILLHNFVDFGLSLDDCPAFNFKSAIKTAEAFYAGLPKNILDQASMSVPEIIKAHGYPCETHTVITSDDYILTMHRIPYGKIERTHRPIVYLQHGLLSSSADWIIPGPRKALGYILADAGYDVWLPNVRGNTYSRKHRTLNEDIEEFWDFSWHEIALYDVTAMIDYALKETKQEKLFYVGHSQGTTVFYVMCSERPEYNEKIRAHFSLAPIAYMNHLASPLLRLYVTTSPLEKEMETFARAFGSQEFLPNTRFLARVGKDLCGDDNVTQVLCTNALFAMCGFNQKQMNATLLPIIMKHTPTGSSIVLFMHYIQEIRSGDFRQWDYGPTMNEKYYNSTTPPAYQLHKITVPVYLIYSKYDWISAEEDVLRLYEGLRNAQAKRLIENSKFNHIDYLYAVDAPKLIYANLLILMNQH
ncbi:hypothetical protein ILUMI_04629 [Ignelater luminosus]|uniref:Lipase n=1 Tax=Ignelater luminosus TaxID=2038154 RepID=A0A8K0DDX6_IGNLU|nr:hypothetical protein ILUMI_04629 [Ignelater luminosus]